MTEEGPKTSINHKGLIAQSNKENANKDKGWEHDESYP